MKLHTIAAMSLVCSASYTLACHKSRPAESAAAPLTDGTVGVTRDPRSARQVVVAARCQRELRCNTVGDGRRYTSLEACESDVQREWNVDLVALECPVRQLGQELPDCLASVHEEPCESPFDTLARVSTCTARQLCLR